jgi:uroporphyrinogen decarboxylase-like protein
VTPRERVLKTVNFQEPDRVPIDLGGMKASGIAAIAYDRLRKKLGIGGPTKVIDPRFMIAHIDEPIRRRLHLDVMPLDWSTASYLDQPDENWVPRRLFDGTDVLLPPGTRIGEDAKGNWILLAPNGEPTDYRMPKNGFYFDDCAFNGTGGIDPRKFTPISDIPSDRLDLFARQARRLYDETDYSLLGWGFGVCFLGMSLITERSDNVTLGRPSEWLMMLMTEKQTCHEMMSRSVDASIQCLKLVHQAVGERCFAWGIAADDSGTQRGEFIRPELWAEMIKPHYRRLCDWIHANTGWKTFFHCCGSVYHLIPHLIEAGVDILNPVQTSAANMDPARLKREFGGRIVFWGGGCDTQHVLGESSPEEIRQHVRERLKVFAPGGGYAFTQIHNVQPNIPPENVIAMFDTAYEFGKYQT